MDEYTLMTLHQQRIAENDRKAQHQLGVVAQDATLRQWLAAQIGRACLRMGE